VRGRETDRVQGEVFVWTWCDPQKRWIKDQAEVSGRESEKLRKTNYRGRLKRFATSARLSDRWAWVLQQPRSLFRQRNSSDWCQRMLNISCISYRNKVSLNRSAVLKKVKKLTSQVPNEPNFLSWYSWRCSYLGAAGEERLDVNVGVVNFEVVVTESSCDTDCGQNSCLENMNDLLQVQTELLNKWASTISQLVATVNFLTFICSNWEDI